MKFKEIFFAGLVSALIAGCGGGNDSASSKLAASEGKSLTSSRENSDAKLPPRFAQRLDDFVAILKSSDAADVKIKKLKPFCSDDFSLHGKGCKAGLQEILLHGFTAIDQIAAYDAAAVDQFDPTVKPKHDAIATILKGQGCRFTYLWKKGDGGDLYLAGDGDKKAFIMVFPSVFDWGGPMRPQLVFDVEVNENGHGVPVADTAVITGPGLSSPITTHAFESTADSPAAKDGAGSWWDAGQVVFNAEDTSELWAGDPNPPPSFDVSAIQAGIASGTPYVITLMKAGKIIATYKQSLSVAPYVSNGVLDWSLQNYTDTSLSISGSTMVEPDGTSAQLAKFSNEPTLGLAQGGTYTADVLLPPGQERVSTGVYMTPDFSTPLEGFQVFWSQAASPVVIPSRPDYQAAMVCVDVATADKNGHRFWTERCSY